MSRETPSARGDASGPASRPLNIVQVSTSDQGGGAEFVAMNLMRAYRERGHRSTLVVGRKLTNDPDVRALAEPASPGGWASALRCVGAAAHGFGSRHIRAARVVRFLDALTTPVGTLHRRLGWEHFGFPATWRLPSLGPGDPTVVHCHNLHGAFLPGGGYFDLRALPWLSSRFPLFLTLHDAWLFTGHCAHSLDCERWRTGCGKCPYLDLYPAVRRDATARNFRRKRSIYRKADLFVATPSRWLMERLEASMLRPAAREARVIPNGIDLSLFHPGDRDAARAELGLSLSATVLLSVANCLSTNPWKDYACLRRAVGILAEQLADQELVFLVLGDTVSDTHIGRARVVSFPFTSDASRVSRVYQAADLYLHAARAETFPTTVLEALGCGIAVVGTAVGGISEQVRGLALERPSSTWTGPVVGAGSATGVIVPEGDADALAGAAAALLGNRELRRALGANAALDARQRFGFDVQVKTYLDWYHEVVASWHPGSGREP